ncbi:glycerate kinase [Desmospora profundinema]|uniref:Glycerate kinase n=1 Tax=Desmospora profundinema TaxID=1571184 RepID=A0ABU1IKY3_9BACL|nr:glycerate kinase [Desmospora profundinema]MDR6224470.1 glycerate kinase [Desmospora profundinema]
MRITHQTTNVKSNQTKELNIVIAPDSYKGSLTAKEVGETIWKAFSRELEGAQITVVPMADGGEGTVEALVCARGGKFETVWVTGPLLQPVESRYGILGDGDTVVMEVANIAGLTMVDEQKRNPLHTSTIGVGQVWMHALDRGYRRFIIGLGGSATNDGGLGMLQALGAEFRDRTGQSVKPAGGSLGIIEDVRLDLLDSRLKECEILVATDVTNPLCGEQGSSRVFGPQKGATEDQIRQLDQGLAHFARLLEGDRGESLQDRPGAGAAGGLGFALLFLGAKIAPGAQIIANASGFAEKISQADWVITGEGRTDHQTLYGKLPVYVAEVANRHGAKPLLISGSIGPDVEPLYRHFVSMHSILRRPMLLEQAMKNAETLLYETAREIGRLIRAVEMDR